MRQDIHPNYHEVKVTCTCGNAFTTNSCYSKDILSIEICSKCHPFYTGEQKIIDTEGTVEKFNKKFGMGAKKAAAAKAKPKAEVAEKRYGLIKPSLSYDDINETDLVVEAVFEDVGVKAEVTKQVRLDVEAEFCEFRGAHHLPTMYRRLRFVRFFGCFLYNKTPTRERAGASDKPPGSLSR